MEIKQVSKVVMAILEADEKARNSDNYLYMKVLQFYGEQNGLDIRNMSVPWFLMNMQGRFPPFETVRRTRQKIQQALPDLRGCEKVEQERAIMELKYKAYAQSSGVM